MTSHQSPLLSAPMIAELEQKIGYHFQSIDLLIEALTHPSLQCRRHTPKNYERLELLGDSILTFVVTEWLFQTFVSYGEGDLAKLRAYLICKDAVCKVATRINLSKYIMMTYGEEKSGGRKNCNNLENAMEALLAAIYLDSNIDMVRKLVLHFWVDVLHCAEKLGTSNKSMLQEFAQKRGYQLPIYTVIGKIGEMHSPYFTVEVNVGSYSAVGSGSSIKAAEKHAAEKLLLTLGWTS